MGLRYTIQYKKGITNTVADALSRRPPPVDFMAISSVVPSWLDKLVAGYSDNAATKKLWAELSVTGSIQRDLPWNKASFVSMVRSGMGATLSHASSVGGHSRNLATYQRIKKLFSWPNLKQSVAEFI
jgi:hypothetical protein